jgi:hypothetical protein
MSEKKKKKLRKKIMNISISSPFNLEVPKTFQVEVTKDA